MSEIKTGPPRKLISEILSKAGEKIKVEGPGVEHLDSSSPKIVAFSHMTNSDLLHGTLALTDKLGGLENIRVAHSSTHRSWKRLGLKAVTLLYEAIIGKDRYLPVSQSFIRSKNSKTGKKEKSIQSDLKPKDWQEILKFLSNGEALITAAYYGDGDYFSLPESSGYLPLILKHHVPNAKLIPVAVLYPSEVYENKVKSPKTNPKVMVLEPLDLLPLSWSSPEEIKKIFPDLKPIELFDMFLKRDGKADTDLSDDEKMIARNEFRYISKQLRKQSKQLMLALAKGVPGKLKPKEE